MIRRRLGRRLFGFVVPVISFASPIGLTLSLSLYLSWWIFYWVFIFLNWFGLIWALIRRMALHRSLFIDNYFSLIWFINQCISFCFFYFFFSFFFLHRAIFRFSFVSFHSFRLLPTLLPPPWNQNYQSNQYDLTLVASDSLNESVTRVVILIKDSNDLPPIFNQTIYTAHAMEELNDPLPFKLLQVASTTTTTTTLFLFIQHKLCRVFIFFKRLFLFKLKRTSKIPTDQYSSWFYLACLVDSFHLIASIFVCFDWTAWTLKNFFNFWFCTSMTGMTFPFPKDTYDSWIVH